MADHNATIATTFPAVTQAATGETDFFSVKGEATLTEVVAFDISNELIQGALVDERVLYEEVRAYTNSATISNSVEYNRQVSVHNSMTATETTQVDPWVTSLSTTGYAKNAVERSITIVLSSSATITDSQALSIDLEVANSLLASNVAEPSGTLNIVYQDTFLASNTYAAGRLEEVTSVGTLSNTFDHATEVIYAATSIFTATNLAEYAVTTQQDVINTFTADDLVSFEGSIANNEVHDTGILKDKTWSKDFGAVAWVLNTETGGLANYNNYGFNSLAQFKGVVYGTSPEGVFALNSDDDEGRNIDAEVELGFLDFEDQHTKRISDIFVGYTGGQLEFDVETYDGPQEVYTYPMEERDAIAPRNNRVKPGRGLSSR
jgi:hypothetical protein